MTLTETAPAKVNLYLHVTGRRENGYHELDSLVVFAEIGDEITLEPSDELSLTVAGPNAEGVPTDQSNLILKAAQKLQDYSGQAWGAHLILNKKLPMAAGVGGGSSDAAAAMRLLRRHWQLEISDQELATMGLSLGADIPICLKAQTSIMRGVGEQLEEISPLPECHLVMVNPGVGLSTPSVFKARPFKFLPLRPFDPVISFDAMIDQLNTFENHLYKGALSLAPVIQDVIDEIGKQTGCALARMSGSGATCFGLFAHAESAKNAAMLLSKTHPGWWVESAKVIS